MNTNPVIIIPDIGQSKLVLCDSEGNRIKNAWPFEIDAKAILEELKGSLMKLMLFRKDAGFSDRIADIVRDVAEPLAVNSDGSKKYNVKPVEFRKPVSECTAEEKAFIYKMTPVDMFGKKLNEDKLFYFAYDFLGDIADVAALLDSFVSFVKEKTACKKVDLLVVGTAGAVLKAYLKDYSVKSDCEKIICAAATLDGSSLVADIFENKLKLDAPASLLSSLGGKAASVGSMAGMLPPEVMNNIITKSLDVIRTLIVDNCTSLWGLIPVGRFDSVLAAVNVSDALKEKVTAQHEYALTFSSAIKDHDFYMLGGCGRKMPPVVFSEDTDSDGIVDTVSATLGYRGDKVWLFRNQSHESLLYNDAAMSLIIKIFCGEDVSAYPSENGSRSVKQLKNELIPSLINLGTDEAKTLTDEYESLVGAVVVENDNEIKNLETKARNIISSGNA